MGFKGPGVYEVVPYQAPSLDMNSWGGSTNPGEKVGTYTRSKPASDNARWMVAQVAGSGDSAEYVFINLKSGCYLTYGSAGTNQMTCEKRLPTDSSVRFKIKYSPSNNYETYLINGVDGKGQANVSGAGLKSLTPIIYYPISDADNTKWYFDPA